MRDFNGLVSGAQEIDPDSAMLAVANINESIQTAQLQEAIEGETFLNFMMPATNFIIMLFYALFPLAMLIMITKGMAAAQYLGGYLLIGIWGYSIFPVATAINYITIANTREAVSALLNMDGFTPFAYDMILDSTANYLAVGSNLLAAAPIVTLAVITGSVFALTSVASSAAAPAGAAGSIAGRSSPQSHGQISELGLSPYMTDHKGNPNVSPVQTHSFDAASSITASAAYTNSSSQKIAANDVQTAKENLEAAKQQTTDSVRQLISRNTAGTTNADETVLANAYQSAGKQVLEQAGISTNGYSDKEITALETAAGYIGTGTIGLGVSGEFGSQNLAKGLSYLTGIDMNQGGGSNQPSAQSRGQVDPSATPGSSDNPTSSIGNGRQSPGGLGASVRADAGLTGGAVGSTRSIDQNSNETSRSGSNSTKTGKTEDVTTTNGTSTNNSGSVKLSDEQQRVIEQHQSDITQASAEYAKATERQRMYSSDAAVGEQFTQGKKLDLNDVQSKMNFTSSQAVLDYMSDHIDNGLKGDLTPKQLEAVKAHYENNAERERDRKVPGAKDATSMLVGAFNAADSTAFDYTQISENPKSNNPQNLTKEQAKQVAEVLSGLDSQLFSEINGVSANHAIQKNAKSVEEGSNQAVEGNRVEARASQETSGINYDNMGAAPTPTPLEQIKGTTESLQSTGGNSERVGSEYGRFFSPESIQNTIDSNAGSLGVSQGTPYGKLNEEQQNQVLAHQTNQALDAVMGLPGIDSSNYESTLSTIDSAGIGQSSNEKNLQAIDAGQAIMSDVANNFNDSVNERKDEISQKEGDYVAAHDNNSSQIVSKSGYGTSSDFIPSMASTLPNMQNDRYDVDVMSSSNQTDGETLSDQQNNWNGQLQAALQKEVSDGNISSPAAQQIFDAHKIDVGSDTTVRQAYAGLVSGNVSGNYDVADSATEHLVDSAKNSFFNEVSKESGSLTDRMSASYSGAPSPIEAVNTQRENARFSTPQNLAYLSEVRDSVKARGGDVSGLSDAELRDKIGAPYTDTASGSNLFRSEDRIVAGIVNDMVNRLPENMSAREATRIIQEPIFQVQGASTSPLNQNGNSSKIK